MDNHAWELVKREKHMKVLPCMWLFKLKKDTEGRVVRYKARLVAGGHRQVLGVTIAKTMDGAQTLPL